MISLRTRQPRVHGLHRLRYIAVAHNEEDGRARPFNGNALLQLETVQSRETQVEQKTARNRGSCEDRGILVQTQRSGAASLRFASTHPATRARTGRRQR